MKKLVGLTVSICSMGLIHKSMWNSKKSGDTDIEQAPKNSLLDFYIPSQTSSGNSSTVTWSCLAGS